MHPSSAPKFTHRRRKSTVDRACVTQQYIHTTAQHDEEHAATCILVHTGPDQIVKTKGLFLEISYKTYILHHVHFIFGAMNCFTSSRKQTHVKNAEWVASDEAQIKLGVLLSGAATSTTHDCMSICSSPNKYHHAASTVFSSTPVGMHDSDSRRGIAAQFLYLI